MSSKNPLAKIEKIMFVYLIESKRDIVFKVIETFRICVHAKIVQRSKSAWMQPNTFSLPLSWRVRVTV